MMRSLDFLKTRFAAVRTGGARLRSWARKSGPFYAGSAAAHVLVVIVVISCVVRDAPTSDENPPDDIDTEIQEAEVVRFIVGTPLLRISELTARSLAQTQPPAQSAKRFDDSPLFEDAGGGTKQSSDEPALGGLGGFVGVDVGASPFTEPKTGVGIGLGTSDQPGNGGPEAGSNGAGKGERAKLEGPEQAESERAVGAALNWLRRHQHHDGSFSLSGFARHCQGETCLGACGTKDDVLATALAVLSFLASGQTPSGDGPYQRSLSRSIDWLLARQATDGGFSASSPSGAPTHAVATLCLCETFKMTGDPRFGESAERALRFLEQHLLTMDGWQWAAITSAQQAGWEVDGFAAREASDWLANHLAVALGWEPFATRSEPDPVLAPLATFETPAGVQLTANDVVGCFATMVGTDRGAWNRRNESIRRRLLATQVSDGCATGSWSAEQAGATWMPHQGRFPTTCFAAILLAAGYRQLPMHKPQTFPVARQPSHSKRK